MYIHSTMSGQPQLNTILLLIKSPQFRKKSFISWTLPLGSSAVTEHITIAAPLITHLKATIMAADSRDSLVFDFPDWHFRSSSSSTKRQRTVAEEKEEQWLNDLDELMVSLILRNSLPDWTCMCHMPNTIPFATQEEQAPSGPTPSASSSGPANGPTLLNLPPEILHKILRGFAKDADQASQLALLMSCKQLTFSPDYGRWHSLRASELRLLFGSEAGPCWAARLDSLHGEVRTQAARSRRYLHLAAVSLHPPCHKTASELRRRADIIQLTLASASLFPFKPLPARK